MARLRRCFQTVLCLGMVAGCTEDTNFLNLWPHDDGGARQDAGEPSTDAGNGSSGTGGNMQDAAVSAMDAGSSMDAAIAPMDANTPTPDTGVIVVPDDDAGM